MNFTCIISKINDKEKETLYSVDFKVKTNDQNFIKNKNAIPTIIDYAINKILETNIPEEIQHLIDLDFLLNFNIIGEGVNIIFDIKDKKY
jgi:hypothetical protein